MTIFECTVCVDLFTVPGDMADLVECCPYCGDATVERRRLADGSTTG